MMARRVAYAPLPAVPPNSGRDRGPARTTGRSAVSLHQACRYRRRRRRMNPPPPVLPVLKHESPSGDLAAFLNEVKAGARTLEAVLTEENGHA
jgi:hypothetical protein